MSKFVNKAYMALYNLISATAWLYVLFHHEYVVPVQCLAILEIPNAIFLLRTPVQTTALQVASRLFIVLIVLPISSVFVTSMIIAWGLTEIVRYTFYFLSVFKSRIYFVTWLRYTLFFVLYPVGAGSEAILTYQKALGSDKWWAYFAILTAYPIGFIVLYSYMIKQRRRYLF